MKKIIKLLAAGSSWVSLVAVSAFADGAFEPVVSRELPVVSSPVFSPGHGFGMTVHAAPGTYGVEESDDLITWNPLADMVLDGAAEAFTDAESAGLDRRFYRVLGDFESSDYHFLDLYLSVEADSEARLFSGFRRFETMRLSTTGLAATRVRLFDEWMTDIDISSGGYVNASAFIETAADAHIGELVFQTHEDGIDFSLPGFSEGNPFERMETREPVDFTMHVIDDGLTTLAGGGASEYTITENQNVTDGREVFLSLVGRKSENASLEALEGEWGFIRYLIEAREWGALYNVGAYAFDVNPQTGEMDFSYVREAEIEQEIEFSNVIVNLDHVDEAEVFSLPISVAADGAVDMFDQFQGFVSASGTFMAATGVDPYLFDGIEANESVEESVAEADSQFLIAVPRDTGPQLAGRSYRVMGMGNWVEADGFEVVTQPVDQNTLVFSSDGTMADLTYLGDGYYAGFGGILDEISDSPETHTLAVSVDPNGLIRMDLEQGGVRAAFFGFAREGGDTLILGGGYNAQGDGGLDTLIAIEVEQSGATLLLMTVENETEIPTEGTDTVIVANVVNSPPTASGMQTLGAEQMHFRIFDSNGAQIVDMAEAEIENKDEELANLKVDLDPLWDRDDLTAEQQEDIIDKVRAILGLTGAAGIYTFEEFGSEVRIQTADDPFDPEGPGDSKELSRLNGSGTFTFDEDGSFSGELTETFYGIRCAGDGGTFQSWTDSESISGTWQEDAGFVTVTFPDDHTIEMEKTAAGVLILREFEEHKQIGGDKTVESEFSSLGLLVQESALKPSASAVGTYEVEIFGGEVKTNQSELARVTGSASLTLNEDGTFSGSITETFYGLECDFDGGQFRTWTDAGDFSGTWEETANVVTITFPDDHTMEMEKVGPEVMVLREHEVDGGSDFRALWVLVRE